MYRLTMTICLCVCRTQPCAVQKRMNRSKCRLGSGLRLPQGTVCLVGARTPSPRKRGIWGVACRLVRRGQRVAAKARHRMDSPAAGVTRAMRGRCGLSSEFFDRLSTMSDIVCRVYALLRLELLSSGVRHSRDTHGILTRSAADLLIIITLHYTTGLYLKYND